jgi:hypothetical protein
LFQYAVVARNYVLVPCMLYWVASWWKKNPIVVALLLGLLANVALHAAAISAGLAAVYAIERVREGDLKERRVRRQLLLGAVLLLLLYAFALWTAWPPHDLVLSRVRGQTRSFSTCAIVSLVWGMCQPWPLSLLFWIAIAVCLHARRCLFYLLPVVCFVGFSGAVYANFWHVGLLTPLVVCLLWMSWPPAGSRVKGYERVGRAALLLMTATQILWSGYALAYDHAHAYSPDRATAQFLRPLVQSGASITVTYLEQPVGNQAFDSVGILPYFDHNIFMNQPAPFWYWSSRNPAEAQFAKALRSRPEIILVEQRPRGRDRLLDATAPKLDILANAGYRMSRVFCGRRPERFALGEMSCHLIFQRSGTPNTRALDLANAPGDDAVDGN